MQEPDAPKIEFPCAYPIKVLGRNSDGFEATVLEIFTRHAPGFAPEDVSTRDSRKGTFVAITITITATGVDQLETLHRELMATGQVQMVI